MEKKSRLINICLGGFLVFGIIVIFIAGVILPKMRANQVIKEKAIVVETKRVEDKKIADKIISDKLIEDKRIADKVIEDKGIAYKIIADEKARLLRVENDRIAAIRIEEKRIADKKKASVVTIRYTIDGEYISACNYEDGSTLQFKVGQSLKLKGTLLNGSAERIMFMNGGTVLGGNSSNTIRMLAVGGENLVIIPGGYNCDSAYTFHIVVSE
ncbi:hypothetical protein [Clostridium sp.]|jgi:hypothetical protein|uniref:hypothetical protein n=1 Tax=Clostridium sp. TaxID=1506 RepID=UPI003EECE844